MGHGVGGQRNTAESELRGEAEQHAVAMNVEGVSACDTEGFLWFLVWSLQRVH